MSKTTSFFKEWGLFILFMGLFILSRYFIWNPVTVQGHSMDPTLKDGERLIMLLHTSIERFDIVVAEEVDGNGKKTEIVKRVVGMPGDTITYKNDVLTVNGKKVDEPYLADYLAAFKKDKLQATYSYNSYFQELAKLSPAFTSNAESQANFTVTVPEGEYFLLGDDRIVSKDSRAVGSFSEKDIIGEVKLRFWPLDQLGGI